MKRKIKHKIHKIHKAINKRIDKFMSTKVELSTVVVITFAFSALICGIFIANIIKNNKNKYRYEDINQEIGNSSSCIKKEDGYYCLTYTKVNWYYEK